MSGVEQAKKLCKQKNYGKAHDVLKQFLYNEQGDAQAYYQMGVIHKKRRDMQASISYLMICLDFDENHRQAQELLVTILIEAQDYYQAKDIAQKYLKKNTNDYEMNFLLGKIQERLENYQTAKYYLQKCKKIKPRETGCQQLLKSIKHKLTRVKPLCPEELKNQLGVLKQIQNQIKTQKSQKQDVGMCVACFELKACYAPKECGHCCFCQECLKKITKNQNSCPICRKEKVNFIQISKIC